MDFIDKIKQLSNRIEQVFERTQTEEATKMYMIIPFFQALGYDFFNPDEIVPEFTADVGKKEEKVDYVILKDDKPIILIEAKTCQTPLNEKHKIQLFRYFTVTQAKFAILTNGVVYQFYTDLDEKNKMDKKPFLTFNMKDIKDNLVNELKKFSKDNFDVESIFNTASELKYSNSIHNFLSKQLENSDDDFTSYILSKVYEGRRTQNVIDKFKPIVNKAFKHFINEKINDRLKTALSSEEEKKQQILDNQEEIEEEIDNTPKIVTTPEELEGFATVKIALKDILSSERLTYKDTERYFGILIDDNIRKWVCRLYFNSENKKSIVLRDENNNHERFYIDKIIDILEYKDQLIEITNRYL